MKRINNSNISNLRFIKTVKTLSIQFNSIHLKSSCCQMQSKFSQFISTLLVIKSNQNPLNSSQIFVFSNSIKTLSNSSAFSCFSLSGRARGPCARRSGDDRARCPRRQALASRPGVWRRFRDTCRAENPPSQTCTSHQKKHTNTKQCKK
jgi:hypothetical protein